MLPLGGIVFSKSSVYSFTNATLVFDFHKSNFYCVCSQHVTFSLNTKNCHTTFHIILLLQYLNDLIEKMKYPTNNLYIYRTCITIKIFH